MSFEQKWLVAMWAKIYQQFCAPGDGGAPACYLAVPDKLQPSGSAQPAVADSVLIKPWLLSAQARVELAQTPGIQASAASVLTARAAPGVPVKPVLVSGVDVSQRASLSVSPALQLTAASAAPLRQLSAAAAATAKRGAVAAKLDPSAIKTSALKSKIIDGETPPIVVRPPLETDGPVVSPPPPPPPPSAGFRAVQILAFLCRPLPRLPSPLPNLVY